MNVACELRSFKIESGPKMELVRSVVKWISTHIIFSIFFTLLLLLLILATRIYFIQSDGTLSEPLKRGTIYDTVYGIGTVTAEHSFTIKPGITSTVNGIFAKEGQFLHKGDKILTLDRVLYIAPFDGVLNALPYKLGENIFPPPLPVAVFTDLLTRYIVVTMEQQGAIRVRPKQKAILSFDSIRENKYKGVVQYVYSYNSTFLARIDLSSLPQEILPDMTADVAIIIREVPNALIIPVAAVEVDSVWVKGKIGFPKKVPIKLGVIDGVTAEVLSGDLHEGDQLIIHKKVGP